MKIAFISVLASNNDLSRSRILNLSILLKENDGFVEFETFVKPVPPLSASEKSKLSFDYSVLRTAPPFCELIPPVLELLENAKTVFVNRFSEKVFIKAFREIGYPMGSASYILEKVFKTSFKSSATFSLEGALHYFDLEMDNSTPLGHCRAMERVFNKLEELHDIKWGVKKIKTKASSGKDTSKLRNLSKHPGVYLFRDVAGDIIYIGKAKNISKRVKSHFSSSLPFERELCSHTNTVDFEETGNETIALLLEAHFIYRHKPKFNTQQIELIDSYNIGSKYDSKGIFRIQAIKKSYSDSENEFYYNRESVINKLIEVQQKFHLCKRYMGIERTASRCSDRIFCKGICEGSEDVENYNLRVKKALEYIDQQRPSFMIKLKGRNAFESGFVLIKNGIYQGFGFIDLESQINSIEDIESHTKSFPHTYYTSRIIDSFLKNERRNSQNIIPI